MESFSPETFGKRLSDFHRLQRSQRQSSVVLPRAGDGQTIDPSVAARFMAARVHSGERDHKPRYSADRQSLPAGRWTADSVQRLLWESDNHSRGGFHTLPALCQQPGAGRHWLVKLQRTDSAGRAPSIEGLADQRPLYLVEVRRLQ